jgi:hypothetical protein
VDEVVAGGEGLVIPPGSMALQGYDADGNPITRGLLGVLGTPPDPVKAELTSAQKRYLEILDHIVKKNASFATHERQQELVRQNLIPVSDLHATFAGIAAGGRFWIPLQYWFTRRALERLTRRVAMFRRMFTFLFSGRVAILLSGTPCIVAMLGFPDAMDHSRFQTLKLNYANRFDLGPDAAHVSLFYLAGLPRQNPVTGKSERWVDPNYLCWIRDAAVELEKELREKREKAPLVWPVWSLEVTLSKNLGRSPVSVTNVPLIGSQEYELRENKGRRLLAAYFRDAYNHASKEVKRQLERADWVITGPDDLDPTVGDEAQRLRVRRRLAQLDALRGVFYARHLRNLRSLFVALGSEPEGMEGARNRDWIAPPEVFSLITHGSKVKARIVNAGRIRITAKHDHPGLMQAVSRMVDHSARSVVAMEQTYRLSPEESASGARVAIEVELAGIPLGELKRLTSLFETISDIGYPATLLTFLRRLLADWTIGWREIELTVSLPFRDRQAGQESRRTAIVNALRKIDPLCRMTAFKLEMVEGDARITMRISVPRLFSAARIPSQLRPMGVDRKDIQIVKKGWRFRRMAGAVSESPVFDEFGVAQSHSAITIARRFYMDAYDFFVSEFNKFELQKEALPKIRGIIGSAARNSMRWGLFPDSMDFDDVERKVLFGRNVRLGEPDPKSWPSDLDVKISDWSVELNQLMRPLLRDIYKRFHVYLHVYTHPKYEGPIISRISEAV